MSDIDNALIETMRAMAEGQDTINQRLDAIMASQSAAAPVGKESYSRSELGKMSTEEFGRQKEWIHAAAAAGRITDDVGGNPQHVG